MNTESVETVFTGTHFAVKQSDKVKHPSIQTLNDIGVTL
jgi:hypothetical protein